MKRAVSFLMDLSDAGLKRLQPAAILCAAAGAAVFLNRAVMNVTYPYLLNLGEPALAQSVGYVQKGIWPYHDLSLPPFSVVPYGPVYLALSALVQFFFPPSLPLAGGRLVCLAGSVAAAVCIGLIVGRCVRSRITGGVAACLFLSLPFVDRWGVQVNVDMTATALELAALCGFFFYASSGYEKKKYFWIGSAAAVAAVFTKSSAVAAAIAWGAHLLFSRRWKDLTLYAATAGGAVLAVYAALNLATAGQYYWHTAYEIGHRNFYWQFLLPFWKDTILRQPVNAAAAAVVLAWPVFRRGRVTPDAALLNLYLAVTVLMTVSLGKQGSDTNYLLAFLAASTIAAGRLWDPSAEGLKKIVSLAAMCAIAFEAFTGAGVGHFSVQDYRKALDRQKEFYGGLSKVVRQFPDPIISWDMTLLIANDRPVYFEPFPMAQAAYSGVWDQTPILEDLRAEKISLIITYFWSAAILADRNFTPEFVKELRAHYRLAGRVKIPWATNSILFFYVPKKSSAPTGVV